MDSDHLRWLWTEVGVVGVVVGLAGLLVMLWLTNLARLDEWAISQVRTDPRDVHRRNIRGEVADMQFLSVATGVQLLVAASMFGAGVAAIVGQGPVALVLLVASELLVVLSLGVLVSMGVGKIVRRRRARDAMRLTRAAK